VYTPKPIDSSKVDLPAELRELIERLAANAHDIWAQRRQSEGWTWGPARDDAARKHPCLVPFDQLPDSEKQYDREVVRKTLEAILALGYSIQEP